MKCERCKFEGGEPEAFMAMDLCNGCVYEMFENEQEVLKRLEFTVPASAVSFNVKSDPMSGKRDISLKVATSHGPFTFNSFPHDKIDELEELFRQKPDSMKLTITLEKAE